MANPRLTVGFEGLDAEYVTMQIDNSSITFDGTKVGGSAQVGLAVTVSANKTIALAQDGDRILGKLINVETGNFATVQHEGGMTLPGGNAATLTPGSAIVGALGAASAHGYIRSIAAPGGAYAQSVATDAGRGRGEILDASDTTKVAVLF